MKISYPSGRFTSVAHLVMGGKDDEDLGSHGGGIGGGVVSGMVFRVELKVTQSRGVCGDGLPTSSHAQCKLLGIELLIQPA